MKIVRGVCGGRVVQGVFDGDGFLRPIDGGLFDGLRVGEGRLPVERWLSPLVPTDILCIGVNYKAHAAETGSAVPENPMLFIKSGNTLNDPLGDIVLPSNSAKVDFEAELCVVIGRAARHVSRADALDYVFGYACANDVSARDWQKDKNLGGGQFARGKSFDTFCPIGPWLVTKDEVPNPNALRVRCTVNDRVMQDASTADMIYDVPALIESLSSTMTLRPGAVILTGTPAGVAAGRTPPPWLKDGDRVAVEIDGLGRLENRCVAERR